MSILKSVLGYVRHLFTLTLAIDRTQAELEELREELQALAERVAQLADELHRSLDEERHQRETLFSRCRTSFCGMGAASPATQTPQASQ